MVASGTNARIAYIGETTRGTTPGSPNFTIARAISRKINLAKNTIESAEVSGRNRTDVRHGFHRIEGDIQVELGMETYNDWLLWSLGTTAWFTPASIVGVDLDVTAINQFTRASGNWIDAQYRPGDWVRTSGFPNAANNGDFRILTVTASVLTVTVDTLVVEAGDADSTLAYIGKKCVVSEIAQLLKTFSLEREILDLDAAGLDLYQIFRGVGINRLNVSANPDELLKATFGLIGMTGTNNGAATLDTNSAYSAAPTNAPFAGVDTTMYIAQYAVNATSFDFTLDNQRTTKAILGQRTTLDLYEGVAKASGNLSVLMANVGRAQRFQDEVAEAAGFQIRANELGTSEFMTFNFYKAKFMTHEVDPPASGPVAQNIAWDGLQQTFAGVSTTYRETMHIQRSTST